MIELDPIVVLASSLTLIAIAVGVSIYLRLGFARSIVWASTRAAVQLMAVGALLAFILTSGYDAILAGAWIAAMIAIAAVVVSRRSRSKRVLPAAGLSVGGSTLLSLAVIFGFGILPLEPIQLIVVAGITIGNALPATVVAADQVATKMTEQRPQVEGMLSLGFTAALAARFVVREATRIALLPQIERTKVVGLVALPGAMTGLLIAGVAPIDAVVIQLVVMFLVLGTVALSSTVVALVTASQAFTPDQRLEWDPA